MSGGEGGKTHFKRADQRSSITILVLGDEGVGKSSLISTFVSRYFAEEVPGIMTRVRLPADPETHSVTTIVDSQGGDAALAAAASLQSSFASTDSLAALMERAEASQSPVASSATLNAPTTAGTAATATATNTTTTSPRNTASSTSRPAHHYAKAVGVDSVDSIVLVDDLDRVETFFRLENHWLPLIERCYQGKVPVIVAENKMDLFFSSTGGAATGGMTEEQARARKRQQIVSLMQRFPFVRQCIKCSAKHLLRVDDVFFKAQQAVLYPFTPPLYDLERGRLTVECKRALTRIFRIYDKDYDGLLSDVELDRFQRETYHVPIFDRDFAAWKKVVTRHVVFQEEAVLQDGKFTVAGFCAIFDVFISQNRLDVVWQALRKFGYDDDLNLHVPDSVLHPLESLQDDIKNWKLTSSAKRFLTSVFHQFDSNKDGSLSPEDILNMFSILPPLALPPWHPSRAPQLFEGAFSLPKESKTVTLSPSGSLSAVEASSSSGEQGTVEGAGVDDPHLIVPAGTSSATLPTAQSPVTATNTSNMVHSLSNSGLSFLSASDSLPSVDVGVPVTPALSYLEWMGHWHAISAISPSVARAELFRLGHVEDGSLSPRKKESKRRIKVSHPTMGPAVGTAATTPNVVYDSTLKSREIRVLVLGRRGCGKTALLNTLCGGSFVSSSSSSSSMQDRPLAFDTHRTIRPETSFTFLKLIRKHSKPPSASSSGRRKFHPDGEEVVVHLVFTDVPEAAAASEQEHLRQLAELFGSTTSVSPKDRVLCDLAMLVFDCTDTESWVYVRDLETKFLTKETPRVFVGTKGDLLVTPEPEDGDVQPGTLVDAANIHCRASDLEPPLVTSSTKKNEEERTKMLDHLAKCALREPGIERLKSRPHEEQKRREAARRRKMMWLGGIVSMGVVVAVGVGLLWGGVGSSSSSSGKKDHSRTSFGWLRSFFGTSSGSKEGP